MGIFLATGRAVLNFIYLFHKLAPVKNRISLISRQSAEPSCDINLLAEKLKKQSPDTEIVISCKMIGPGLSGKLKYLCHMITKQMHLFASSKAVVLDGYCISACVLKHKKNLKIYQMWHAMGALKKFGWASVGEEEGTSLKIAEGMRMHKGYTKIFVSSDACKSLMAPAFGCSEDKMQVMPLPRCDLILSKEYNESIRAQIYEKYPGIKDKQVILYAPTFRKKTDIKPYAEELIRAVDYEKYALIVKLHPLDKERITSDKAIIDSSFSSMQWLSCTDHFITDYSAAVFEAALAGKAVYRYVPDFAEYEKQRGLFDIFYDVPGEVSSETAKIVSAIDDNVFSSEEVLYFAGKYCSYSGSAAGSMAGYILAVCKGTH